MDAPNTLNSKVSYKIQSGSNGKFYINPQTGIVKIVEGAKLDRDLYGSYYILEIAVNDFGSNEKLSNTCFLRIDIVDVNNKRPIFYSGLDLTPKVYENAPIGTVVKKLKATDTDLNSNLSYFIAKRSKNENKNSSITNEMFEAFDERRRSIDVDLVKVC
jgi:hypothetical protein